MFGQIMARDILKRTIQIIFYNDGFISICAPDLFDSDNDRMSVSNKWALFKFAKSEVLTPPWRRKKQGKKRLYLTSSNLLHLFLINH